MKAEVLLNILDKVLKLGFTFLLSVFMARTLSKVDFGVYTIFAILVSSCLVISGAGIDTLYARDVAKDKGVHRNVFTSWLIIRLLISLVLFFLVRLYLLQNYPDYKNDIFFVLITCFLIFSHISEQTLVALIDNRRLLKITLTILLVFFLLKLFAINSTRNIGMKFLLDAIEYVLVFVFVIKVISSRFLGRLSIRGIYEKSLKYVKDASPLWLNGVLLVVYSRLDQFYVATVGGALHMADYGIATNINSLALVIPTAIMTVYFPRMVQHYSQEKQAYIEIVNRLVKFSIVYGIAWALLCYFLSEWAVTLIYGHSYISASKYLSILSLSSVFLVLGQVFGQHMIIIGRYWVALKRSFLGILFTLSVYAMLGNEIDIVNIAIIVVVNSFIVNVCSYFLMKDGKDIRQLLIGYFWKKSQCIK
ncbi:oligosaccharide flippase family protein [Vibrio metschnikovii]|uniref:oligosaccharide flippase family protein n=1 Tax=Vibrio metschnikovii TaxID=28172 RepID=UPI001C306166|nr:oligosaccharide flippase family protein [Vibrio metschnikovii]